MSKTMEYSHFIESKQKSIIKSGFAIDDQLLNNKLLKLDQPWTQIGNVQDCYYYFNVTPPPKPKAVVTKEKQKANQPGHKFNLLCDVNNTLIEVEAAYSATSAVMNKI